MRTDFVGRSRELAVLAAAFAEACAGRAQLVLCRGEPGIGKTRLAEEFVSRADGAVVAWGTGMEDAGAPPYWPWREVLGASAARRPCTLRPPSSASSRTWPDSRFMTDGMMLVMPKSGSWSMFSSAFARRDAVTAAIAGGIDVAGLDRHRLLDGIEDYVLASLIVHHRALPEDVAGPGAQAVALEILHDQHPTLRRVFADSDPASITGMRFKQSTLVDAWPSTNVTVLGDAIHNMTPVGGLGANSALRDAAALAGQLLAVRDGSPLLPAIAAYESGMREWGYAAVRESSSNAQRAITANPVARRAAHAYFRTRRVLAGLGRRTRPGAATPIDRGRSAAAAADKRSNR